MLCIVSGVKAKTNKTASNVNQTYCMVWLFVFHCWNSDDGMDFQRKGNPLSLLLGNGRLNTKNYFFMFILKFFRASYHTNTLGNS